MKKLHFGCFNCQVDGWLNTDVTPHLWLAKIPILPWVFYQLGAINEERYNEHCKKKFSGINYLDVTKRWPYNSNKFDAIFSSHVLEHLSLAHAKFCLSECYRCLSKGGVLRISVPDLDAFIRQYNANDSLSWATKLFEANETREKNMHHFMYNYNSLHTLLRAAGFEEIYQCDYFKGICPDIEKLDNRPDSLFVEAIK